MLTEQVQSLRDIQLSSPVKCVDRVTNSSPAQHEFKRLSGGVGFTCREFHKLKLKGNPELLWQTGSRSGRAGSAGRDGDALSSTTFPLCFQSSPAAPPPAQSSASPPCEAQGLFYKCLTFDLGFAQHFAHTAEMITFVFARRASNLWFPDL